MTEENKPEQEEPGDWFDCSKCGASFFLTDEQIEEGYDTDVCEDCQALKLGSFEVDDSEVETETETETDGEEGRDLTDEEKDLDDDDDDEEGTGEEKDEKDEK